MELNWDNANEWQDKANNSKVEQEPKWKWDCNFKLNFDGDLLSIESRFYPPIKHYGDNWDGKLRVRLFDNIILEKDFECKTLEELKKEVESFTRHYKGIVKSKLR